MSFEQNQRSSRSPIQRALTSLGAITIVCFCLRGPGVMSEGFLGSLDLEESFKPLKPLPWPLVSILAGIVASHPLLQFGRQFLTMKPAFFLEKIVGLPRLPRLSFP